MIHNRYRYQGGEDAVFLAESQLLAHYGNAVEQLVFDNRDFPDNLNKFIQGFRGIYNVKSALTLRKAIKRFKPDVIHVHNFFPLASPSIFYEAKKCNIPTVVTLHNFRLLCPSGTLYYNGEIYEQNTGKLFPWDGIIKGVYRSSRIETLGLAVITVLHNLIGTWKNKVDRFIVLTEFARKKFSGSALRANFNQFIVKPNFVEDFGKGEVDREDYFLIAGRLSEEKGIDIALKAAAQGRFKLIIIGDGPLKDLVVNACISNPNISYLGFQQKDVIIKHLKRCTALLLPSVCYEGFPISLLESFATATAVIVSRLGPLAEIVEDFKNGLHFAPGNANDLAEKMTMLASDPTLRKRIGENARSTYLNNYTPEENYKKLMDIYTKLPILPSASDNAYGK